MLPQPAGFVEAHAEFGEVGGGGVHTHKRNVIFKGENSANVIL